MSYISLEKRIHKAIDIREKGDLINSGKVFKTLISDIKKLQKTDDSKELKYIYATAMGEYVIQKRLEAAQLYGRALKLGRELFNYDRKNKIGNPLSLRAVSNTLINLGAFEKAEEHLRDLIPMYKDDSAKMGDTKAHLAFCLLRTGRISEASNLINEAIEEINLNTADDKYVSIKLSGALNVEALIFKAKGEDENALECAQKALDIARENKNVFRITQAQEIIDYLQK